MILSFVLLAEVVISSEEATRLYRQAADMNKSGAHQKAIALLREVVRLDPQNPAYRAELGQTLAWAREFVEAEAVYRSALGDFGPLPALQLGLARVQLWHGRFPEASGSFQKLLDLNPRDVDALMGLAQAKYWSGDYRLAKRLFHSVLVVQPGNEEARRSLSEIESASRPLVQVHVRAARDNQPYSMLASELTASGFTDPLTRWDLSVHSFQLEDRGRKIDRDAMSIGVGISTKCPSLMLGAEAGVRSLRFTDDEEKILGHFQLQRPVAGGLVSVTWRQSELFNNATSLDNHVYVETATARLEYSRRWLGSAAARHHRYSDGNRGGSADIWFLVPVWKAAGFTLLGGGAISYQDTKESRFELTGVDSRQTGTTFQYRYRGVYNPYWTPHDLAEVRLNALAEWRAPGDSSLKLLFDGGMARDEAVSFGPSMGPGPVPVFAFPVLVEREYNPWSIGAEFTRTLGTLRFQLGYRHVVTVFYRADEYEAGLVRHF